MRANKYIQPAAWVRIIVNKRLPSLIAVLCITLLPGCSDKKVNTLSQEEHRHAFFPEVNPESISDYQFYYQSPRGGYLTCARLTLTTNVEALLLQEGFKSDGITNDDQNAQDQQLFADLLYWRTANMVEGTNSIPEWMKPKKGSSFVYMERKNQLGEHELWWDANQRIIYFTGSGTSASWVKTGGPEMPK